MGARRIRQRHGLADLRGVRVRDGLREDRARPPHRALAGEAPGPTDARPRLRDRAVGPRCSRRSRRRTPRAAPARSSRSSATSPSCTVAPGESPRAIGAVPDVGRVCHDVRHQLDVRHRARAEPVGARDGEDRRPASRSRGPSGSSGSCRSARCCCSLLPWLTYKLLSAGDPRRAPKCRGGRRSELVAHGTASAGREIDHGVAGRWRSWRSGSSAAP